MEGGRIEKDRNDSPPASTEMVAKKRRGFSLKPPLKWAGGKRWLIAHLKPLWQKEAHRRLVEPFCGGLAVALGLLPARALLNDINPYLINFYSWIKKGLKISLQMENDAKLYYRHRESFNQLVREGKENTQACAEYFYYLNRTGYNGLCRLNSTGEFNVPFGKYKQIAYKRDFSEYAPFFSQWEFSCRDFEVLPLAPDDFVYVDPPYDVEFTQYSKENFHWEDQKRLALWLAKHPGPVVASNQATARILKLYRELGFEIHILTAPRFISSNGDRTPAQEMLALRNLP
jgi:DNA adenine methylase